MSAQPEAHKICLYPKVSSNKDIKLEDLKPGQAVCFEDEKTLKAFNSATSSLFKFTIYQGGIYGTFTDKKNKEHLIIVGLSNGVIVDLTKNKAYTIEEDTQRKWYDAVNVAMSKKSTLK